MKSRAAESGRIAGARPGSHSVTRPNTRPSTIAGAPAHPSMPEANHDLPEAGASPGIALVREPRQAYRPYQTRDGEDTARLGRVPRSSEPVRVWRPPRPPARWRYPGRFPWARSHPPRRPPWVRCRGAESESFVCPLAGRVRALQKPCRREEVQDRLAAAALPLNEHTGAFEDGSPRLDVDAEYRLFRCGGLRPDWSYRHGARLTAAAPNEPWLCAYTC